MQVSVHAKSLDRWLCAPIPLLILDIRSQATGINLGVKITPLSRTTPLPYLGPHASGLHFVKIGKTGSTASHSAGVPIHVWIHTILASQSMVTSLPRSHQASGWCTAWHTHCPSGQALPLEGVRGSHPGGNRCREQAESAQKLGGERGPERSRPQKS